ncbi:MAG: hypothetical protein AAB850_00455, partial [Patescibacteria group bacterium]
MEITTESIKELREITGGVSVMQCKEALLEAGGDLQKATAILKKHSTAAVLKKAQRTLSAARRRGHGPRRAPVPAATRRRSP